MEYECRYLFEDIKPKESESINIESMTDKQFSEYINS